VSAQISQAFLLGAGLGTRLRPLTENLPKPLVPVANRPLLSWAMDHLRAEVGTRSFLVNTHHCPDAYGAAFPDGRYRDATIEFRHEPVLLDTGGGIDNIRDWLPRDESFLVYNGDILSDLPLAAAARQHRERENAVTLVLRSTGEEKRVGFDPETGRIVDLRGKLRPDWTDRYQFTGIYFVAPAFLPYLAPGKIESVVLAFLRGIEDGAPIGGVVVDEGTWSDLGDPGSYLASGDRLAEGTFPRYSTDVVIEKIHPAARIVPGARIDETSFVGAGSVIGAGATVERSILWDDVEVDPGVAIRRSIIRSGIRVDCETEESIC